MKVLLAAVLILVLGACGESEPAAAPHTDQPHLPSVGPRTAAPAFDNSTSPPPTRPPTSLSYPRAINDTMTVDDGHYRTVEEMAQAAELVVIGDVVGVVSLGRPDLAEDEYADEYVAVTVQPAEVLKGDPGGEVVLGWDAIGVDPAGDRVATLLSNGIRPPQVGDRMLLFLIPARPEFLAGVPTHEPVLLDGIAYIKGDRLVAGEVGSHTAARLLAMPLRRIRAIVGRAVEKPRVVGEPIKPGGL